MEDGLGIFVQRLELATIVMDDAHRGTESHFHCAPRYDERIALVLDPCPDDRIDVYVEVRVFFEPLQLFIQHFQ